MSSLRYPICSKYVITYLNVYMSNCVRHLFAASSMFETVFFSLKHIYTSCAIE